jgi:hypothetical protein
MEMSGAIKVAIVLAPAEMQEAVTEEDIGGIVVPWVVIVKPNRIVISISVVIPLDCSRTDGSIAGGDLPGAVRLTACSAVALLLLPPDENGLNIFAAVKTVLRLPGFDRNRSSGPTRVWIHPSGFFICLVIFKGILKAVRHRLLFGLIEGVTIFLSQNGGVSDHDPTHDHQY